MEESASIGKNSAAEEYPDDGGGGELLGGHTNGFPDIDASFRDIRGSSIVLQLCSDQSGQIPDFHEGFAYPYRSWDCGNLLADRLLLFRASKYSDGSIE